jgi:gamma-glutamylputrescine oxidase
MSRGAAAAEDCRGENVNASERADYAPSWYTATMVPAPERGPLTFDLDVEVCVIGGGLAGLTAAREIARRGWSVALLEGQRVAWNASGRNDGFVLPGFAEGMDKVVSRVGIDHAKALWALSVSGVEYVRTTIRETAMPGVEPIDGWLKVSKTDDPDGVMADLELIGQELGTEIEGWPIERVREVLKTNHYFHALHLPRAFHIHPLNYALGLATAAETAGARIFERTPALSIDIEGVRKRIATPQARVRAGHIVLACSVHLGTLMPRIAGTLVPIWAYVVTTAPLGPRLTEAITYRGGVTDTDLANHHYRVVGGDRLLFSGRSTTWEADPRRYAPRLKADIEELYPQLAEVEIEHVWSGVLGNALHRMPQIGEISPGLWITSGFGGHGLNTTAMAGRIISQAIVEGDDTWRLFSPYEFVWAGGRLGRAIMQGYYWGFTVRERFQARQARQREEEFRRAERLVALRAPEEQAEAQIGAAVPADQLPAEPDLVALPADPVITHGPVPVAPPMTRLLTEPAPYPLKNATAGHAQTDQMTDDQEPRPALSDASFGEESDDPQADRRSGRARRPHDVRG